MKFGRCISLLKNLLRIHVSRLFAAVCLLSLCVIMFTWQFEWTKTQPKAAEDPDALVKVEMAPYRQENVAYALVGDPQLTQKTNITGQRHPAVKRSAVKGFKRAKNICVLYSASAKMNRTVYINVLGKDALNSNGSITLVTQLTSERVQKFYNIIRRWSGPISVSVYVSQSIETFITTVKKKIQQRRNIAMHLVAKHGAFFPVNFLRNVALRNAQTKYVFLTDVDFEPMPKLDIRLQEYIKKGYLNGNQLLVVPVFESKVEPKKFPVNKHELLHLWTKAKTVKPFHFEMKKGKETPTPTQSQTDYPRWKRTNEPYLVNWALFYEPYVVTEKSKTPEYLPDFVGRFFNKFSQLAELFAMGYEFLVLPDVFALHTPHAPQPGTRLEYWCGKRVIDMFRVHLMEKYEVDLPAT